MSSMTPTRRTALVLVATAALLLALLAAAPAAAVDYDTDCPMIPSCITCLQKNINDANSDYYCTLCQNGYTLDSTATSVNGYCLCGVQYCNVCTTDGSGKCATNGCVSGTTYKNGACEVNDSTTGMLSTCSAVVVTLLVMFAF